MIPVAFYAPLKSPEHEIPSGDRTMGRLLLAALRQAGFAPELASELRSLDLDGDPRAQEAIRKAGEAEAARLIATFRARPREERPRLWFTYHCYYKAPDWIGPRVADALAIPYAVAEGSRSARRAHGAWALAHAGSEAALDRADCLLVMTPHDAEDLEPALREGQSLVCLPPFLDISVWLQRPPLLPVSDGEKSSRVSTRPDEGQRKLAAAGCPPLTRSATPTRPLPAGGERSAADSPRCGGLVRLLTVAMMRSGDKLSSYRLLAEALALLPGEAGWILDIVGDGPARDVVEALFAPFGSRVRFRGALYESGALAAAYGAADLLVWPACGEAYGMTLLEAQACGCPVLAGREGGVPAVLREGETGFLAPPRDASALAEALAQLLGTPERLRAMREPARRFVRTERDLRHAAAILHSALMPLAIPTPGEAES